MNWKKQKYRCFFATSYVFRTKWNHFIPCKHHMSKNLQKGEMYNQNIRSKHFLLDFFSIYSSPDYLYSFLLLSVLTLLLFSSIQMNSVSYFKIESSLFCKWKGTSWFFHLTALNVLRCNAHYTMFTTFTIYILQPFDNFFFGFALYHVYEHMINESQQTTKLTNLFFYWTN